jgi:hypothetical protein
MRVLSIEGIPGPGKSTMAEKICAKAKACGINAKWYLEEAHDHPLRPQPLPRPRSGPELARCFLSSARGFVAEEMGSQTLHILEGTAFQSTVRFLMEEEHDDMENYFHAFEEIFLSLSPILIYLRPYDARSHLRFISDYRGEWWTTKVAHYLEKTSYCSNRRLLGVHGMHEFWSRYATLCDSLVKRIRMPQITVNVIPGEWDRHLSEALAFLERSGPLETSRD